MITRLLTGLAMLAVLLTLPAQADNGRGAAPSAVADAVFPRFATSTELFEFVGVLNGKQLTVYLDRFEDNAPVKAAKVDLEISGVKVALKELADGEFQGTLGKELAAGVNPVTATVVAGSDTDLLAADLDIRTAKGPQTDRRGWKVVLGWSIGALLLIAVVGLLSPRARATWRAGGAA